MANGDRLARQLQPPVQFRTKPLLANLILMDWRFPLIVWLASRCLIVGLMVGLAPHLPVPPGASQPLPGWGVFVGWDGKLYELIATQGYEALGAPYAVFFPLYPLLSRLLMSAEVSFAVAGTIVNNLAFLGALIVVHRWVAQWQTQAAARWVTAVLAWYPLSLFGTVTYTEGLYLFCSLSTLQAFDQHRYRWAIFWGILTTASRPTGIALLPALGLAAWKERRPLLAYGAAVLSAGGLGLFILYGGVRLGDPLAFYHAQKAWRPNLGIDWNGWLKLLTQMASGPVDRVTGFVRDPLHPLLFTLTCAIAGVLLWARQRLNNTIVGGGLAVIVLAQWLLGGDAWLNIVAIVGGSYLLWHCRHQLRPIVLSYGVCGLSLILGSGSVISLNRIAYGVVSLVIALGIVLSRYPRWGYVTLIFFAVILSSFSIRFAQQQWVA